MIRRCRAGLAFGLAALVAPLVVAAPGAARGLATGAITRIPKEADSDIGLGSAGDPAVDFMLHCQGCHRRDGRGLAGAVPDLRGSVARIATLPGGREYLSRVPGFAQSTLDDEAAARLLNWMLAQFDPGHLSAGFIPFTAAEVGPLRRNPLVAASVERARVLGAAPDADRPQEGTPGAY